MPDPGDNIPHRRSQKQMSTPQTRDVGIQVSLKIQPKSGGRIKSCMLCSVWTIAVIVGVFATGPFWDRALGLMDYILFPNDFVVGPQLMEDLGMEGVVVFKQHDRNGDGMLSLEEFEPIAHRLLQLNDSSDYELPINEWDDVLTIQSFFTPLNLSTMTKSKDEYSFPPSPGALDSLHGIKFWLKPAKEWKNFAVDHLKHFLPGDPYLLESVGEVYSLIMPLDSMAEGATLSSNRYLPPPYVGERDIMIHRLLSMFHPRPFIYSRFGPQGSLAIIRATNEKFVDISFRIHAEFQLNEPPFYPYWFTPAQFMGNIIISKDGTKVISFHLYVPNDRKLNVDMEWQNGPKDEENMEVDIGKMDRMELRASRSSIHVLEGGVNYTEKFILSEEREKEEIVWKQKMSLNKAERELEVTMYPFKKVDYHNFTEAFQLAQQLQKPVHSILLWGALDDQSC